MPESILLRAVLLSLAGGVLSLDRTAAFQTMVSRPIVVGPLIGYLLGNAGAGLMVGVTLELLLIGDLPVGAYVPVHETGLTVLVTAITVMSLGPGAGPSPGEGYFSGAMQLIPGVLLVTIPVSKVYQRADTLARSMNRRFFHSACSSLESGGSVNVVRENMKGLVPFFLTNVIALFITVTPLMAAASLMPKFAPEALPGFLYPALAGCIVLGIAAAFNAVYTVKGIYIFSVSGIVVATILMVMR